MGVVGKVSTKLSVPTFDYSKIAAEAEDLPSKLECRALSIHRCAKEASPHLLAMAEEVYEAHSE